MSKSLYNTIIESSAPTTSTEGVVGNFYIDTSASPADLYLCTNVDSTTTPTTYEWTKQGGNSGVQTITGTTSLFLDLKTLIQNGNNIVGVTLNLSSNPQTTYSEYNISTQATTTNTGTLARNLIKCCFYATDYDFQNIKLTSATITGIINVSAGSSIYYIANPYINITNGIIRSYEAVNIATNISSYTINYI